MNGKTNQGINYPPKIICPNTANIVHRPRLFNTLDKARLQAKIIWIAAPGGSGKTTLVSSYLEEKQVAHCWYQVDEDDRDLATFFHYLGLAGKLASPRRKKNLPKFTSEYKQKISAFTRHFFKDISSRLQSNGLIVLDNFQLLPETDPLPLLLPNIVGSLPSGVSLLIISRHLPPATMAEFSAKRQLFLMDTKQVRFEKKEWLAASQLFEKKQDKETILSLYHKLDGWIAGLVLLPEIENTFENRNPTGLGIEILDTYIAGQFLSSLDEETSELLMKVSYMPHISITTAIAVSHIPHSKKILAALAQKNLFVLQQGKKGYTLHPLVREYLKQHARAILTKQQLYDLRLSTAHALLTEGDCEAAADLLIELEAQHELVLLILRYAPELHGSGRVASLQRYINTIPEDYILHEPWINFWKGKIFAYKNVIITLDLYDQAYIGFMEDSDIRGIYMSWYSAISVICSTLLGDARLVTWINRYYEFSLLFPEPPQDLPSGFIESILLQSYFLSNESPKKRISLQTRLVNSIDETTDPVKRLHMMSYHIHVAVIFGVKASNQIIIEQFESDLDKLKEDPVLYLGALTVCSLTAWAFNDFDKLLNLEFRALEIAKESGVSVFDCHIYTKIVVAALGLNKFDLARQYLNIMRENIVDKDRVYQSLYFFCLISAGTYMNETDELDSSADHYLNVLEGTQFPAFIIHHKLFYLYYLCVQNKTEIALVLHNDLLTQVQNLEFPGISARFYMIYAKIFYGIGDFIRCDSYLKKSFTIARKNGLITYGNWDPTLMMWACQRALLLEIETTYLYHFIDIHYANLPEPDPIFYQWPRPFRIHTFGKFQLKTKKGLLNKKQQTGKLNALLKTLVKAQSSSLTSDAIKEILYGDDHQGKSSKLLDTQIHRLRKLLGDEKIILRQGDSIKLHLKYFWIDVREFEALGKRQITNENALETAMRLQEIYKGEYLSDDEELEIVAQRERYRNIYLATLFRCLDFMESNTGKAIEFCQNALILEPLSEPLYRRLITFYLRQDNLDMAETTLTQCRRLMKQHLDCDVSNETLSLLKRNLTLQTS